MIFLILTFFDSTWLFILQVVQSSTSPVTCSTTAVRSNFKYGYHVFGQQEATFNDVEMQGDMVVIARFYLRRRPQDLTDEFVLPETIEPTLYDEETLVAWATVPLVLSSDLCKSLSVFPRKDLKRLFLHEIMKLWSKKPTFTPIGAYCDFWMCLNLKLKNIFMFKLHKMSISSTL